MTRSNGDLSPGDDDLVRQGGVFVPRNGGREVGPASEEWAPDEVVEDPINDDGVPGTVDDLPYDYGVEVASAADQMVEPPERRNKGASIGRTGYDEDGEEPPLGRPEERELWRKQRGLIDESGDEALRYRGLLDERIPAVESAVGEDAGEVLPEAPEGESATGTTSGTDAEDWPSDT